MAAAMPASDAKLLSHIRKQVGWLAAVAMHACLARYQIQTFHLMANLSQVGRKLRKKGGSEV